MVWTAYKDKDGYGLASVDNKTVRTHRVSYEMNHGPIPEGMYVLHKCDNPSCINPEHLFAGTQRDNVLDMRSKGRQAKPKEYCKRGHKRTPDNVDSNKTCRQCGRDRHRGLQ